MEKPGSSKFPFDFQRNVHRDIFL